MPKCDFNKVAFNKLKNTSGWLLLTTPVKLKFRLAGFEDIFKLCQSCYKNLIGVITIYLSFWNFLSQIS